MDLGVSKKTLGCLRNNMDFLQGSKNAIPAEHAIAFLIYLYCYRTLSVVFEAEN